MLSCRPAHAARCSELAPDGEPLVEGADARRNVRICGRVRISRELVTSVLAESAPGHARWADSAVTQPEGMKHGANAFCVLTMRA